MTPDERAAQWCGCGHRRTAHTFADLGECAGCPNGTCLSPFTEQLSWTDTDARDEIRRLQADAREAESLIDTLSGLLDGVAVALRGPAEPGTLHDWSRLPRESDEARAEVERLRGKIVLFANDCVDLTRARDEARAEVDHVRALLNAKRAWIDGAKVDLDGYDEARAALDRVRALCEPVARADNPDTVARMLARSVRRAIDGGAS